MELKLLEAQLKIGPSNYEEYICDEQEYLKSSKNERSEVHMAAEYITLLEKLKKARCVVYHLC